jgi:hypothetical protein
MAKLSGKKLRIGTEFELVSSRYPKRAFTFVNHLKKPF